MEDAPGLGPGGLLPVGVRVPPPAPRYGVASNENEISMQVTETSAEGLKREYNIIVPAGDIEDKLVGRLTEIGQSVTVPGFRPGKVPVNRPPRRRADSRTPALSAQSPSRR